ncbi:MAG: DUF1501 domain-containing protein [Planctomycetaceae bacterium]
MTLTYHQDVTIHRNHVSRRGFLRTVSAGSIAAGTLGFHDLMAVQAEELRKRGKSMILLFMQGGPSQFETFDPKPGTSNGGPTKAIDTAVPGIQIAQGWEKTAAAMKDIALVRSMTNREGNHRRAAYQMRTGYLPSGSVKHPSLGANFAKQLADPNFELPSVVGIGRSQGAGFLGVDYEPFMVSNPGQLPNNVATTVTEPRYHRRLGLLDQLEDDFAKRGGKTVVNNHRRIYGKASKMVLSKDVKAFDISSEPESIKAKYGNSNFGRACLLGRRLVETGVTFVEIASNGWDTHNDNFNRINTLAGQVDPAFAALVTDLKERGQLDDTLVVWMGEFGRTPRINPRTGRDHYPRVFNVAMAGCGIKGGQVIGASDKNGTAVADKPVTVPDLLCTFCEALKVNPRIENISPLGRPMKIVDGGKPVKELFA